ncbi:MAG: DUF58 domain-containing protein [Bacillota bacterium]
MTGLSGKPWRLFLSPGNWACFQGHNFILPTRRMVLLLLAGIFPVLAGYMLDAALAAFWAYNGLLVLCSAADLLLLPGRSSIGVIRRMPVSADVGKPFLVEVEIANNSGRTLNFAVTDDLPDSFSPVRPPEGRVDGKSAVLFYNTAGRERGKYHFHYIYLRYWGGMGLWKKQARCPCEGEIKIFPDLTAVRGYLSSPRQSLVLAGRLVRRKVQAGTEFHSIREYLPDDDPRFVNWAASARAGEIMANVYQPERGKTVTILLDCGRMMGIHLDGRVKLDRTLEAALILAAVALRQGDLVSVLAFSNRVKAYVPPGKGAGHLYEILEAVYHLRSEFVEADYRTALEYLLLRQKRRSLVVVLSDMDNYLFEDRLAPYLLRLRRTHVPLLLTLNDPCLLKRAGAGVEKTRDVYIKSIARKFIMERREYAEKMRLMGISLLDVPAESLALAAVNFYFDVKSRGLL